MNSAEIYKWIAGGLGAVLLVVIGFLLGQVLSVSREQVREIIKDETLSKQDVKEAFVESFTDISQERGMYVLEGRPRLETLEQQYREIKEALARIEKRMGDGS